MFCLTIYAAFCDITDREGRVVVTLICMPLSVSLFLFVVVLLCLSAHVALDLLECCDQLAVGLSDTQSQLSKVRTSAAAGHRTSNFIACV